MPSSDPTRLPSEPAVAPYGTWASSVTARAVAAGALRLSSITVEGNDIYWVEGRPDEGGRSVVVTRTAAGRITDVTPAGTDVRTRVHEYGGAAYAVWSGIIYYSEFADQRVYRLAPGGEPEALTLPGDWFYADYAIDVSRRRMVCIREDHTVIGRPRPIQKDGPYVRRAGPLDRPVRYRPIQYAREGGPATPKPREGGPVTTLVSLPLAGPPTAGQVVVSGHDFYATPRFSPDGSRLSWLAWRHPQMPWDGTELWVAEVAAEGAIERPRCVAGSESESIFQPRWSPDGTLYFASDRTGWWNLYRLVEGRVEAVHPMTAEFGRPQWQLGTCTWAFADVSRLVVAYGLKGRWYLATIDLQTGAFVPVATDFEPADSLAATRTHAVMVGGSALESDAVLRIDFATGVAETIRVASAAETSEGMVSVPEAIEFPIEGGLVAHAFYYAPHNEQFTAPADERPPLIVFTHGGPTAATHARLNLEVQYWTSRGFAVVDVNYGGSAGYGRAYRERLKGQWGVVDVADCINAAKYLAAQDKADAARLIIRGRSAGGYTTLAALTFHAGVFKVGTSYYGIGDLELLARDTHKFESRYLDGLIGPYPAKRDVYRARSPINFVERLACPLLLFQGLQDPVVPPNQAQAMAEAVRAKGLPVALITFDGEQHGFRKAATITRCLEIELFFYGAVFGFTPSGVSPAFDVDNLDRWGRP